MTAEAIEAQPVQPKPPNNLVGLGLLAVFVVSGAALQAGLGPAGLLTFVVVMAGWVLAVMAHEFGHALVGYIAGDWTVKPKGYLSFDPRRYGHVGVSLVIPVLVLIMGGVGFPGGAVYLNTNLMRSRLWRTAASLAGPASTLLVLLLLALVLKIWFWQGAAGPLFPALSMLALLQAMALILNLLPLPGLDGFNALRPFLPKRWGRAIHQAEGLSLVLLFVLILAVPGASALLFQAAAGLADALGVDRSAMQFGWNAFHFWR